MTVDIRGLEAYADLLATFQPRPIRNEREAADVSVLIDELTDLPALSEGQRDFVALLGQLLHAWESEHEEPIEVSPQEIVRSLLEDNGLRQVDLVGPVFPVAPALRATAPCHALRLLRRRFRKTRYCASPWPRPHCTLAVVSI